MGLRINTNVAALNAERNLQLTNNRLGDSLQKLSTGLRINKAADDAAGMTIADGLGLQSNNLLEAISNGNHAISAIQLSDQALQKTVDLINQISQRAITAANDTEDSTSRAALQADVSKFLAEINNISNTTSYKGTRLLDGSFTNKFFQVGAYADQTISLSINKTASTVIGKIASASGTDTNYSKSLSGTTALTYNSTSHLNDINAGQLTINGVDVNNYIDGYDKTSQLDAKNMTAAINQVTSATGVTAKAVTTLTANAALQTVTIADGALKINGVNIGATNNANLVADINKHSSETGVTASINDSNKLVLTAADGRNIAVDTTSSVTSAIHIADNTTTLTAGTISLLATSGAHTFYINGVSVTYGNTGSVASAGKVVAAASAALATAGVTDITVASGASLGAVAFTINDGHDLNTYVSTATTKEHLANTSAHGTITLTSDKSITVGVGTNALIGGFTAGVYAAKGSLSGVDVTTQAGAETAITRAGAALTAIDTIRGNLGAAQNQIQATVENLQTTQINVKSAESNIRDVNFAEETANFSKLQILAQSGTFALAQANTVSQNILRLLR